jgi:DNA modification methylase
VAGVPADRPVAAGLVIRRVPLSSLHADPANARSHGERNLEAIQGSLARFGQAEPLVVQRSSGRIVGGNGRLVAMKALGWTEADVVELDLDDLQATALGIALNRTGELAEWDMQSLSRLLTELKVEDAFDGLGFEQEDLDRLIADLEAEAGLLNSIIEDEVPAPSATATTRRGDLWLLGNHRLLCGDSASVEDVDRLVAGQPIHLVNMDPPYNVKVEPRSNNAIAAGLSSFAPQKQTHHQKLDLARHPSKAKPTTATLRPKDRPLANDFISDKDFATALRAWFGNAARVLLPGRAAYIWGGYANCANYPSALAESGLYFSQSIIWVKEHPVLTRKDFMGNHEWCFYSWKEGAAHVFLGPNNATDVWEVKKLNHTKMVHLTEKPVELAARALQYSSRKGENVLDLFGGSGSTMAACEQLGRRAHLMELDELYADVIVDRWQRITGGKAVLEASGKTFDEVKAERLRAEEVAP